MEMVCQNHVPITITRKGNKPVVMMSLEDYTAQQETFYLLHSPQNKQRLLASLSNANEKKYQKRKLIINE